MTVRIGLIGNSTEHGDILTKTGLNWKVKSEAIQTVSGIVIPDTVAMIREDTNVSLGIHTDGYVPYQNDQLLELLYRIGQSTGLQLHSGGYFGNGGKVWLQLKSNDLKLPGGDIVKGYISGFNSFDGRTALAFGNCNLTVSCMNTFWRGYRSVETRLRHSSMMINRIDDILRNIDKMLEEEKHTFTEIERLNVTPMNSVVKELVTRLMFDIAKDSKLDGEEISTAKKNKMERFNFDLDAEVAQKGNSLWGLFSGITRYTTHSMKNGKDNTEAKIFGMTGQKERAIWEQLVTVW